MNRMARWTGIAAAGAAASVIMGLAVSAVTGGSGGAQAYSNGAAGSIIAVTTGNGQRMYLIDTEVKAIMVYEATGGARGFSLVAGRPYVVDREYMRTRELKYNANGYRIDVIQKELAKSKARSGRR